MMKTLSQKATATINSCPFKLDQRKEGSFLSIYRLRNFSDWQLR